MVASSESDVDQLREEAEANRARLAGTVGELRAQVSGTITDIREKLSPSAVKAEVNDYVRDTKDQLLQRLEAAAMENPLRTAAIGAAVAYPIFNLVRAMPAPLLLIGAGLFLSGAGKRTSPKTDDDGGSPSKSGLQNVMAGADSVKSLVTRGIHDARDVAAGHAKTAMDTASSGASGLTDQVSQALEHGQSAASDMAASVVETASNMTRQAKDTVSSAWDKNPLIVAGAGLAIGAFIAAALPSTKAEERLLGDASAAALKKAADLSGQALDTAQSTIVSTMQAAEDQGLSPDGLQTFAEDLTQKAAAVLRRGVEAAISDDERPTEPSEETEQ